MQPSPRLESILSQTPAAQTTTEITIKLTPFDRKEYRALIEAREQTLRRIVKRLKPALSLSTAVDAGCGVGFFSQTLAECGLSTCGFDGRAENVEEARKRFPGISFEQADVEAREISQLGRFDLTLCFGLLYHLENPLQAIRNLNAITEHLKLNRCSNVDLIRCAAGDESGEADLYEVNGFNDWFNSLRAPATAEPVNTVRVPVRRLDDILSELLISKVDFIKLDVEGAELSVLYGATKLLNRDPRPAMLVEVQDIRTKPWGYAAREILQFLIRRDYQWFAIAAKGALLPIPCNLERYDANLVALPIERAEEFLGLLGQK